MSRTRSKPLVPSLPSLPLIKERRERRERKEPKEREEREERKLTLTLPSHPPIHNLVYYMVNTS
jgi:hypothetical protein